MEHSIAVFSAHAGEYHALRRRLIPCFDTFYATAVELLGAPVANVLDLGAGTGILSAAVLERYPRAIVTLLDGSAEMLEQARRYLPASSIETRVSDLRDPLPQGPFDAVVSGLAIHHLDDEDKRDLFARVHAVLRPGGAFVNAEQVAGPTPALQRLYREWWQRDCRAAGAGEEEIAGALERMQADRCSDVASQLQWLREAGFVEVDCLFKQSHFAVLAGRRGEK